VSSFADIRNTFRLIKKITFSKLVNAFKLHISYCYTNLSKTVFHWGSPDSISIEPTTKCNLHCLECAIGQNNITRPKGEITQALFEKIVKDVKTHIVHLNLYFQGESFLHSNIFSLIELAKKDKIYTTISTNGHFLNQENVEKIISSGLDKIIVSIDGISQETYEKYRVGGSLEKVLDGLKLLSEKKKNRKAFWPYIEIQFIAFKHNENELSKLKEFFKDFGVQKISIKKAFVEDVSKNNELLPKNKKLSRYEKKENGEFVLNRRNTNKCWRSWRSAVITWNGDLIPCCFDKNAKHSFGDLSKESFKEVWKSQQSKSFRRQIKSNRAEIDICNNCVEGVKYKA
jgi:radical SAM protein with 4Fe4S-binding SPASM domain